MIAHKISFLLVLVFFAWSSPSRSEGGCPPGMIPYSGNNIQSCGPLPPGYQQQQATRPQAHWVSQWQAIAADIDIGVLGTSQDQPDDQSAISAAIQDCKSKGGANCVFKLSAANGCVAMSVGYERTSYRAGRTMKDAESAAFKACSEVSNDCKTYYSNCNPAKLMN